MSDSQSSWNDLEILPMIQTLTLALPAKQSQRPTILTGRANINNRLTTLLTIIYPCCVNCTLLHYHTDNSIWCTAVAVAFDTGIMHCAGTKDGRKKRWEIGNINKNRWTKSKQSTLSHFPHPWWHWPQHITITLDSNSEQQRHTTACELSESTWKWWDYNPLLLCILPYHNIIYL